MSAHRFLNRKTDAGIQMRKEIRFLPLYPGLCLSKPFSISAFPWQHTISLMENNKQLALNVKRWQDTFHLLTFSNTKFRN
jgi:hypothetical protein